MEILAPGPGPAGVSQAELTRVLAQPAALRTVFQPIVDLHRGVVAGYETLARFTDPTGAPSAHTPDLWFEAADRHGVGAELEAVVVERCSLRVPASAGVAEVACRVVARPEHCRFDQVVCVDDVGAVAGIVRVERILSGLAEAKGDRATGVVMPAS